ncbi:hypothetical protein PIB30_052477 [Stylosanthes scabra]|uniref:Uncharacterized protein n=1 Tax=Stylosanthes scabra TaxID=79078 RepID=A0ABU6RIW5_9FABA|nr:hypothetical protein [Stylosanthes scabra]
MPHQPATTIQSALPQSMSSWSITCHHSPLFIAACILATSSTLSSIPCRRSLSQLCGEESYGPSPVLVTDHDAMQVRKTWVESEHAQILEPRAIKSHEECLRRKAEGGCVDALLTLWDSRDFNLRARASLMCVPYLRASAALSSASPVPPASSTSTALKHAPNAISGGHGLHILGHHVLHTLLIPSCGPGAHHYPPH